MSCKRPASAGLEQVARSKNYSVVIFSSIFNFNLINKFSKNIKYIFKNHHFILNYLLSIYYLYYYYHFTRSPFLKNQCNYSFDHPSSQSLPF